MSGSVVSGVIGFPGPLLDDDAFSIPSAPTDLRIDIILPIGASWKTSFSVLEVTPSDIAREWNPPSRLDLLK